MFAFYSCKYSSCGGVHILSAENKVWLQPSGKLYKFNLCDIS